MIHVLHEVLTSEELSKLRTIARSADLVDGATTNPTPEIKNTQQLRHDTDAGREAGTLMRSALTRNRRFGVLALPLKLIDPRLVRYQVGAFYAEHIDTSIFQLSPPVRADVACTLFISDPADYQGGELITRMGDREIVLKEPAGSAVVYPASSIHRVEQVTEGERIVGITWLQSLVRDAGDRELLFKLEELRLLADGAPASDLTRKVELELNHVRTLLMRKWMEV